jgi:integrase
MGRPRKSIRASIRPGVGRWQVQFAAHPGHWILTPIMGDRPELEAIAWAKRNGAAVIRRRTPALKEFAAAFFDPAGPWACRMRDKGHHFVDKYLATRQGHVDNYLVPIFGELQPAELTRRLIDDAILAVGRASGADKPLSGATRNKIIYSFHLILEDLVDRGMLDRNPLEGIVPYSKAPVAPRDALPRDIMARLFPASHGSLVQVWGGSMWASLMLLFQDTGMRPGEARALRWVELYDALHFIAIRHGIEAGTAATVKGTKTGIVKAGYLSARTVQELAIWRAESKHAGDADFIFTLDGEAPVTNAGIVKAFRRGISGLGLNAPHWTPYYLRHSFVTYQAEILSREELQALAGHTNEATNRIYQHLDDMGVYRQNLSAKEKLDKSRES